jgi:hypothetical protein
MQVMVSMKKIKIEKIKYKQDDAEDERLAPPDSYVVVKEDKEEAKWLSTRRELMIRLHLMSLRLPVRGQKFGDNTRTKIVPAA